MQSPEPERVWLGWKCPKCGKRVGKQSRDEMIFVGEQGSEFGNEVASKAGLAPGLHTLSIDWFVCRCGYEFAKASTRPAEADKTIG